MANWGSYYPDSPVSSLLQGALDVQTLGAKNLMVAMGPNYATLDYNGTDFGTVSTLEDLAKSKPFQTLFSMPFTTFAIDVTPLGDGDFFQNLNTSHTYKEMYDLIAYLYKTYAGSGKNFILKNWEGDSQFVLEDGNPTHPSHQDQIKAMQRWLNARHQALVDARNAFSRASGVSVTDAIEFKSVDCARLGQSPCVLTEVIPKVASDMLSYSAYETINLGAANHNLTQRIDNDLAYIRNAPGVNGRPLMIGEYGFPDSVSSVGWGNRDGLTHTATQAFIDANIPYAFNWQIRSSNGNGDEGMGLIAPDGSKTPTWTALRQDLQGSVQPVGEIKPASSLSQTSVFTSPSPFQYNPLLSVLKAGKAASAGTAPPAPSSFINLLKAASTGPHLDTLIEK